MIKIDAAPKTKVLFVVYDNDSFINWFPQGISYLISYVSSKLRGVRFDIFPMDVRHDSSDKLKSFLDKNYYDVVAISVIAGYYQYKKLGKKTGQRSRIQNRYLKLLDLGNIDIDYLLLQSKIPSPHRNL
jgi:hypothetical protein